MVNIKFECSTQKWKSNFLLKREASFAASLYKASFSLHLGREECPAGGRMEGLANYTRHLSPVLPIVYRATELSIPYKHCPLALTKNPALAYSAHLTTEFFTRTLFQEDSIIESHRK